MDARYEARKQELLEECDVAPQVFERVMARLERFMQPFVESLSRIEQVQHARTFVQGLLSDLEPKNHGADCVSVSAGADGVAMVHRRVRSG